MTLVFLKSTRTACTYYTCGRVHGTRRVCNFYRHSVTLLLVMFIVLFHQNAKLKIIFIKSKYFDYILRSEEQKKSIEPPQHQNGDTLALEQCLFWTSIQPVLLCNSGTSPMQQWHYSGGFRKTAIFFGSRKHTKTTKNTKTK